jgi:hypothetical protein
MHHPVFIDVAVDVCWRRGWNQHRNAKQAQDAEELKFPVVHGCNEECTDRSDYKIIIAENRG